MQIFLAINWTVRGKCYEPGIHCATSISANESCRVNSLSLLLIFNSSVGSIPTHLIFTLTPILR